MSVIEQRRPGLPPAGRGQPPRSYAITPAGRERFLSLLLTPGAYSRDTPEEFVIKLTKFQFLTPAQAERSWLDQQIAAEPDADAQ